jgi:hypothetical protein
MGQMKVATEFALIDAKVRRFALLYERVLLRERLFAGIGCLVADAPSDSR